MLPRFIAGVALFFALAVQHHAALEADTKPQQIHIAFGGQNGMNVAWFTQDLASKDVVGVVQYGLSADNLNLEAKATKSPHQYMADYGYHWNVLLPNLQPKTIYYYRVGDSTTWSATFHFTSAPTDNTTPFSVSIFGDMGFLDSEERPKDFQILDKYTGLVSNWTAIPSHDTLQNWTLKNEIDFVWHIGDIGYADDSFADKPFSFSLKYEGAYNGFMNWLQNISAVKPYMVAPGNHESECHSLQCIIYPKYSESLRNFTAYNGRWHMPSEQSGGVLSMWYSFDYGPVHFVSMNSETDFPGAPEEHKGDSGVLPAGGFAPSGAYLAWLEADLKAASDARANKTAGYKNWLIVGGHRPFQDIRGNGVEEMFQKYGVDIYFAGHVHSYLRSAPTAMGKVDRRAMISRNHYHDAQGTVYVVAGGTGCDEMKFVGDPATGVLGAMHDAHVDEPVPFGSEVKEVTTNKVSIGKLQVFNATAVRWTLYDSANGDILDDLWVTKSASGRRG